MQAPGRGVEVDEGRFAQLAKDMGVTPKEAVEAILGVTESLPLYVNRAAKGASLGEALETLLDISGIAYVWDEAIREIVGGRRYAVQDGGVDLQKGTVWISVVFPDGAESEIASMDLYFGNDSGETASGYMDIALDDGELADEAMDEIHSLLFDMTLVEEYQFDFEYDYSGGTLSFSVTAHTGRDFTLPKFDEMNELFKKIKEVVDGHHQLYALASGQGESGH